MNKRFLPVSLATALALTGAGCQLPSFLSFLKPQTATTPVTTTSTAQVPAGNIEDAGIMRLSGKQGAFSIDLEVMRLPWGVNGTFSMLNNGKGMTGIIYNSETSATSSNLFLMTHTDDELGNLEVIWPSTSTNTVMATWTAKGSANALSLMLETKPMAHAMRVEKASVSHKNAKGDEMCSYQSGYPLLADSEKNARIINTLIESTIAGTSATSGSIPPVEQRASEYIANCVSEIQSLLNEFGPEGPSTMAYSSDASASVTLNVEKLLSIRFDGYDYTGGAHGNPFLASVTIDTENGKALALKDLFKSDQLQAVLAKERQILLSDEQGGYLYEETNAAYEEFLKQPFAPAAKQLELYGNDSNFYLTDSGIVLYHTAYEIAAYAAGQFETVIPYSELKEAIRTDGPLASYIK